MKVFGSLGLLHSFKKNKEYHLKTDFQESDVKDQCIGFAWEGFSSRGATGVASV